MVFVSAADFTLDHMTAHPKDVTLEPYLFEQLRQQANRRAQLDRHVAGQIVVADVFVRCLLENHLQFAEFVAPRRQAAVDAVDPPLYGLLGSWRT